MLAVTQSAMFDTKAFEDPDQFIPGRNWYHYFHFGLAAMNAWDATLAW